MIKFLKALAIIYMVMCYCSYPDTYFGTKIGLVHCQNDLGDLSAVIILRQKVASLKILANVQN